MSQLCNRRVEILNVCQMCNGGPEDIFHLFVQCPFAQQVWRGSLCGLIFPPQPCFISWFNHLLQSLSLDLVSAAAMVLWSLWQARNDMVWNQKTGSVQAVLLAAATVYSQWQARTTAAVLHQNKYLQVPILKWCKPLPGYVKCNFDAALFPDTNKVSYGWIIRDECGSFVAAKNGFINCIQDPALAEALSCREALSWLKERTFSRVVLETDCQVLQQALVHPTTDSSLFGLITQDCSHALLALNDSSICVVRRSANHAAHLLAKAAGLQSGPKEWGPVPPSFIFDVLVSDLI